MSSTNRSDARDSHIADYYVTPQKPIKDFLFNFCAVEGVNLRMGEYLILDPCAGGDIKHAMSYPTVLSEFGVENDKIITNDIREDSPAMFHENFLFTSQENKYDIVITNPPFAIAQQIIENSLKVCKNNGYVIMLLRLNYIGSQARQMFWNINKPYAIYAHNKRMSFTDDNKTDSIEYAHFVWKKGVKPDYAKFYILKS